MHRVYMKYPISFLQNFDTISVNITPDIRLLPRPSAKCADVTRFIAECTYTSLNSRSVASTSRKFVKQLNINQTRQNL